MLVAVGWWPHDIPFEADDLNTVISILNEGNNRPPLGKRK